MEVVRVNDMETRRGPEDWFTGNVWMDAKTVPKPGAGFFRVFFEAGARTNWHTHPEGQILYIVTGEGHVGKENGPVLEVRAGDLVAFAPDEKHWHGAAPHTYMVHIAISPAINTDGGTDWLEPVTDEEYEIRSG